MARAPLVTEIMIEFAKLSGLSPAGSSPQRYLWTDAFAVCNFLELYRETGDELYKTLALLLVDQVHFVLGRHRADDSRISWISSLDEQEGARHPTIGGLRIGKEMSERGPEEPFEENSEWDRDGQYYHYLTQWMHALDRMSRVTGDATYNRWAIELAKTAHARFTYLPNIGERRMYWKMSIDLSRPLVGSMGMHDPLDGLITYSKLQATAQEYSKQPEWPDLHAEIADMARICKGKDWATDDPLGIGGLLSGAYKMTRLIIRDSFAQPGMLESALNAALAGLDYYAGTSPFELPADYRLAFRELGLSIGLQAVERLKDSVEQYPGVFKTNRLLPLHLEGLMRYAPFTKIINAFWLKPKNRESVSWTAHRSINMVMLATSLAPAGYLSVL